jgi:hypothetical protein
MIALGLRSFRQKRVESIALPKIRGFLSGRFVASYERRERFYRCIGACFCDERDATRTNVTVSAVVALSCIRQQHQPPFLSLLHLLRTSLLQNINEKVPRS